MSDVSFRHLFDIDIQMGAINKIGPSFGAYRAIGSVAGGTFTGDRLKGTIQPGTGGDWVRIAPDGTMELDVRLTLETEDGALILMRYHGVRAGEPDALKRYDKGEHVEPDEVYFRTTPIFETGDERYTWLNNIVAVGVADRGASGPLYHVYEML